MILCGVCGGRWTEKEEYKVEEEETKKKCVENYWNERTNEL